jgi:hypothetical protein
VASTPDHSQETSPYLMKSAGRASEAEIAKTSLGQNLLMKIVSQHERQYGIFHYVENYSPYALHRDKWLRRDTSYIYAVGVLTIVDSNKVDWVSVYIGSQRDLNADSFSFIGRLIFERGENDDIERTIARFIACLDFERAFGGPIAPLIEDITDPS